MIDSMLSRGAIALSAAAAIVLCAVTAAVAVADSEATAGATAASGWSEPLHVRLVSASRSISLAPGVDPAGWAAAAGLERFQVFRNGNAGTVVETPMFEQEWQDRSAELCAGAGVQGCETSQCQSIQLAGRVDALGARPGELTTARLLRRAPSLEEILARRTTACVDDVSADGARADGAGSAAVRTASDASGASGPPRQGSGVAGATPEISVEDGVLSLPDEQLPDDPENWTLAVAVGCTVVKTPLDAVVPAMDRTRVVALVSGAAGTAQTVGASLGLTVLRERPLTALQEALVLFEVPAQGSVAATVALLVADPRVSSAQPDYLYRASADAGDPYAFMNYAPSRTGAVRLHANTTGGGQLIAVVDTGIDLDHPELKGQVVEHRDLTDFGWSADVHGTAVAGIIAAHLGNGIGSYGVAPGVRVLALKACQPVRAGAVEAHCWTSTLAQALDAAIAADARIINLSLGGPPDPLVERYVGLASAQGRLVVAAAGNAGPVARPTFPAALPDVVAVTATDAFDRVYREATTGAFVDVAAPGVDIVVPGPQQSYPALSGTSLATAHFTGVAALLMDLAPRLSSAELRGALTANARDLGQTGIDEQTGAGLVDACAATAYATGEAVVCRGGDADGNP